MNKSNKIMWGVLAGVGLAIAVTSVTVGVMVYRRKQTVLTEIAGQRSRLLPNYSDVAAAVAAAAERRKFRPEPETATDDRVLNKPLRKFQK